MAPTKLPPRRRTMPIDTFAGVAPQFERTDGGYIFRRNRCGPAIPVSIAERDAFTAAALRSVAIHAAALAICIWAGWLFVNRMMADRGDIVVAIAFGIVLSLIAVALYGSLRWNADAPGRALAGRPAIGPARDPDFTDRQSYGGIIVLTLGLLFLAAIGTRQPAAFYVTFATVAVMVGLFLAIHKWWFDRSLTPEQRVRAEQVAQQMAQHAADRAIASHGSKRMSCLIGLLILFMALLQIVVLFGGFVLTAGIVLAIAGTTTDQASTMMLVVAYGLGIIVAVLLAWGVERLCRRWTGESAIEVFSFIPPGW